LRRAIPISSALSLLLTCFLWAVSFIAIKVALASAPPLAIVTLRLLISSLCFILWFLIRGNWPALRGVGTWVHLFFLSLFGTGLHYGVQTIGLQMTTASNASIYAVTGPISIALLAAACLGERISSKKALGILVAVIGVLVVMGLDTLKAFDLRGHLMGDILVMVSIAMWGVFTVYGKRLMAEMGAFEVIAITTVIGSIWMVPIGLLESHWKGFALSSITLSAWAAVVYLGIACSFLATLLYFIVLKKHEAQKVGIYFYTIPPMTYLAAAFCLGEEIHANLLGGSVLVLAGVYLTERG
jgi:drug/metabolite transporter (DMT)-like permease